MKILDKARKILETRYICDNCLGRQFAQLLTSYSNKKRGEIIRGIMALYRESEKDTKMKDSNFQGFNFRFAKQPKKTKKKCEICGDIFKNIDRLVITAEKKLRKFDFDSFLVGTKLSSDLARKEEKLWEDVGIEFCEPIKAELNREIGREIEKRLKKTVDFKSPDIVALLDLENDDVIININPLFIFGEYKKLKRGFPQTKWPSDEYKTSVEEIIAKKLMKKTGGSYHKFHGAGREDIDARCLDWRPFVLEISEPEKRLDKKEMKKLEKKINKSKKIQVKGLKLVKGACVKKVKEMRPDKTYRVLIKSDKIIERGKLKEIKKLKGQINQRTPQRVLHRRADKIRKREIKDIKWKKIEPKRIQITVKAEAGTYIKELITGDEGRTEHSLSKILDCKLKCEKLDVLKIHIKKFKC